jgi:S-adenosylmethionine:tRNA ribosyltransferase-isomerase
VVAKVAVAAVEGRCEVRIEGRVDVAALLEEYGELPLPPYIKRPDGPTPLDRERYQTVFGRQPGAVAAPTAGLHFTERLLGELCAAGVELAWLTLEVGPATFMPVRSDSLRDHRMEGERADLPPETVEAITAAKREKRRVIGVGTTTARALESRAAQPCGLRPGSFLAESFLRPGVPFRVLDGLMTNFHLPGSTLLMLVSGFAGREQMLDAYAEAVALQYRFYSYGDAMLIV